MELILWPASPDAWLERRGAPNRRRPGPTGESKGSKCQLFGNVVVYREPAGWVQSLPPVSERYQQAARINELRAVEGGDLGYTIQKTDKRLRAWAKAKLAHFAQPEARDLVAVLFVYPF